MNRLYITAVVATALGLQALLGHAASRDGDRAYREAVDRIVEQSADAAGADNGPVSELARITTAKVVARPDGGDASSREAESVDCFYKTNQYHPACETGRE